MPCYRPLTAYQNPGEAISFTPNGGHRVDLPCGRCIGCRTKRTLAWATRCMHEAQMHKQNSFVTLTYGENCEPSLNYEHFQDFLRSLRRERGPKSVRFFAAGEYGKLNLRPHWHALLFGVAFTDLSPIGSNLYRSPQLEQHWPHGYSSVGEVTFASARYVASYCIKKRTGTIAEQHYTRLNPETGELFQVEPEMAHMSLKPGIGQTWIKRYWPEVYKTRDGIVMPGGKTIQTPRYYDQQLEKIDRKLAAKIETDRMIQATERQGDNTTDRLKVKEQVAIAKHNLKKRTL